MPPIDHDGLVEQAARSGYLTVDEANDRITYHCHGEPSQRWSDPEERVRAATYAYLIVEKGYAPARIKIEVRVPRRVPHDRADIVLYRDDECRVPWLVVENKAPGQSLADRAQGIEQAFGYGNSLRDTALVLYDESALSVLFDLANFPQDERENNIIGSIDALPEGYGDPPPYRFLAGGDVDIRPVGPDELERKVRRAHAAIWAGGRRDPLQAFELWSKLILAKLWDEQRTPTGEPRRFQARADEDDRATADRIRALLGDAVRDDPSIYRTPDLDLPDDKVCEIVRLLAPIGVSLIDLDSVGAAFESFFSSVFRGELGQYFTRRELARFTVAALDVTETDRVLDPTVGSGGFLLEVIRQVWDRIESSYAGQPVAGAMKRDFPAHNVYGIEINETLGHVCQTNLRIHGDGHTHVDVDRSCLDAVFSFPLLDPSQNAFSVIVGNPPFGDSIRRSNYSDHLGEATPDDYALFEGSTVASEKVVVERAVDGFLSAGGRLGFILPDGNLNNPGKNSGDRAMRHFLLKRGAPTAIVSLPDHAFRKTGAQNKTSILLYRKFTPSERVAFDAAFDQWVATNHFAPAELDDLGEEERSAALAAARSELDADQELAALAAAHEPLGAHVFLAEAEHIGYSSTGAPTPLNDLYSVDDFGNLDTSDKGTILGQLETFRSDASGYSGSVAPACEAMTVTQMLRAHVSGRWDPKYHVFTMQERRDEAPEGFSKVRLSEALTPRRRPVVPNDRPDEEFTTVSLSQGGRLSPRKAGIGRNPIDWHGAYFKPGQRWYRVREGDLLMSRIDLWKGAVTVVPDVFDGAIVTNEFPAYEVDERLLDPRYLQLLLRTPYWRRAIRAITTGHSNRRRTQARDFLALEISAPDVSVQREIADLVWREREAADNATARVKAIIAGVSRLAAGEMTVGDLHAAVDQGGEALAALAAELDATEEIEDDPDADANGQDQPTDS